MKILTLIFALYLLALPAMACAEKDLCTGVPENTVSQAGNHADDKNKTEDCGSFCTCSCCVHIVSVHDQSLKIEMIKPLDINPLRFFYDNISLPSNYFGNIWQPPKIS